MEYPIGHAVVVRSSQSGVWFGRLEQAEPDGPGLVACRLTAGRRIWSWTGAGSCSGLAAQGPRSGRIASPVDAVVCGCCEILVARTTAIAVFEAIPEWAP